MQHLFIYFKARRISLIFFFAYNLGHVFVLLATISITNNNIVLAIVPAGIWEHGDVVEDEQTCFKYNLRLDKLTWNRK